jgi:hypothetical protein
MSGVQTAQIAVLVKPQYKISALGIAAEIFCEATNKRLQRIARPVRGTPKE